MQLSPFCARTSLQLAGSKELRIAAPEPKGPESRDALPSGNTPSAPVSSPPSRPAEATPDATRGGGPPANSRYTAATARTARLPRDTRRPGPRSLCRGALHSAPLSEQEATGGAVPTPPPLTSPCCCCCSCSMAPRTLARLTRVEHIPPSSRASDWPQVEEKKPVSEELVPAALPAGHDGRRSSISARRRKSVAPYGGRTVPCFPPSKEQLLIQPQLATISCKDSFPPPHRRKVPWS